MKNRNRILLLTASLLAASVLGGCGQRLGQGQGQGTVSPQPGASVEKQTETQMQTEKQTEKQTEAPAQKQTEKATEKATEKETEKARLITSVDYTSKDGTIKITLPDNTWKITQDTDDLRVFQSEDAAIINIAHATTPAAMGNLTVYDTREDLEKSLKEQYPAEGAYDILSYAENTVNDVDTARYVVRYNNEPRMWAYIVTSAIVADDQAYVITGTVTEDNKNLLEAVQKSVESFKVLRDDKLKLVTSQVVSGTTQKSTEKIDTTTGSNQELGSLTDYGYNASLVTNDAVNVRSDPGTDSSVLTTIDKNTQVTVVGETSNWFKVNIDGNIGYIRKDFLVYGTASTSQTEAQTEAQTSGSSSSANSELASAYKYGSSATLYASTDVNIRTQPGTDSSVMGNLGTGNSVTVIGETDNWYIVSVNGTTGYVSREFLSGQATSQEPMENGGGSTTTTTDPGQSMPAYPEYVSGQVTGATADTITITTASGSSYTVYYGGANISTQDGLYEGVTVEVAVDPYQSSSSSLYATDVVGY